MTRSTRTQRTGFSLVEVLIAMGIVVVAIVGLLPLFTGAVMDNIEGRESTRVGNHGRSEVEGLSQLGFNNWELEITAGTERTTQMFYTSGARDRRGDEEWVATVPAGEIAPWMRTSTIRQLGINRVQDTDLDGILDLIEGLEDTDFDGQFDNPLPAGTTPGAIHLKQLEIQVQGQKTWAEGGAPSDLTVEALKAF